MSGLMWLPALFYLAVGYFSLAQPQIVRRTSRLMLRPSVLQAVAQTEFTVGLILVALASLTHWPGFVFCMGLALFLGGLLGLTRPDLQRQLTHWWINVDDLWYRAYGVLAWMIALGFIIAAVGP